MPAPSKPWPKRKWEQFTNFARTKAEKNRRANSTTAGPLVATCPLVPAGTSTTPPPAPTEPCDLAKLSAQLHVRRGKKEDWLPSLENDRLGPELTGAELTPLKGGRERSAEEQAIVDAVKDHALVVAVARSFSAPGGGYGGRERWGALEMDSDLLLRGQVTSEYADLCDDRHPTIRFVTNYGKSGERHDNVANTYGAHLRSYAADVRSAANYCDDKDAAIAAKVTEAEQLLARFEGSEDPIAKREAQVDRRKRREADARKAIKAAERDVRDAQEELDALPADSVNRRRRAVRAVKEATEALDEEKQALADLQASTLKAETALKVLQEEKANAEALKPVAAAMGTAAAALATVAGRLATVADEAYQRVRGKPDADTQPIYDAAHEAGDYADGLKGKLDAILARLEEALRAPDPTPPGGIAGRPVPKPVDAAAAATAGSADSTAVTEAEAKATEVEGKVRRPAAAPTTVDLGESHEAAGTDTMQPVEMKVRTIDLGVNWIRDHLLVSPRNWLKISSTRREMIVEAESCGYPQSGTGTPRLSALIYFQGLDDVLVDFEYRGLQWGISRGIRHEVGQAPKARDPGGAKERVTRTTTIEGEAHTLGLERVATVTSTSSGNQGGRHVIDATSTNVVHYNARGENVSPNKDEETQKLYRAAPDLSLAFTDPYEYDEEDNIITQRDHFGNDPSGVMKNAVDDITAFNSNLGRALYAGLFRARVVVNGIALDTGTIADLLTSLQEIVEVVRFVVDLCTGTAKSAAMLAFPVQFEAGVRAEVTVAALSIVGRRWAAVDPDETISTPRCYIEHAAQHFEVRFDITVFDGKVTFYVGAAVVLGHPKILRVGLNLELAFGGVLRIYIPLITDKDEPNVFGVQNKLLCSIGLVFGANAGPIYFEAKGEVDGSIDLLWDFVYRGRIEGFECTRADVMSNGVAPRFTANFGSKIKIPFFPGGGLQLWHYEYPPENKPYYFIKPSTPDNPLYSWKKDAKKSKARTDAEARVATSSSNKTAQEAAALREAKTRHKRT